MQTIRKSVPALAAALAAGALFTPAAHAIDYKITVTVENLAPANGIAFAPLRLGFNSGVFDAFDIGGVAGAEIVGIAEGGSDALWNPAFLAADPTAVVGSVLPGGLLPGASSSAEFIVDSDVNPYFTFAAMVIPSNDFFIGNDDPMEYELFDPAGNLLISSITINANEIWDAGSEVFDPSAAAFLVDGVNGDRTPQNSVVAFNFAELAAFNGLETAAGYIFNSQLAADSAVYRISFDVTPVPEPQTYAMLLAGLGLIGAMTRRRLARIES
jgi:hypothetical protein